MGEREDLREGEKGGESTHMKLTEPRGHVDKGKTTILLETTLGNNVGDHAG